jgi:hypothetical protein
MQPEEKQANEKVAGQPIHITYIKEELKTVMGIRKLETRSLDEKLGREAEERNNHY